MDKTQDALRVATKMANVLFNFAQKPGYTLTSDDVCLFDKLRKEWDAVRPQSAPPEQAEARERPPCQACDPSVGYVCEEHGEASQPAAQADERELPQLLSADDCVVHIFPSDLLEMSKSETVKSAYSVAMSSSDERTIPLLPLTILYERDTIWQARLRVAVEQALAQSEASGVRHPTIAECHAAGVGPCNVPGEKYHVGGLPNTPEERERFEAYMRGHCWYIGEYDEVTGGYDTVLVRQLYGVWRDRGALAAPPAPALPDVKTMVNRFLGWKLPKTFAPDCGISFDGRKDDEWNKNKSWPIGTNLMTADEAEAMFRYVLATSLQQGDEK